MAKKNSDTSTLPTTGLTLIVAEKPSVANDLAKALGGKFTKEKTHLSSDNYIISWAIGHLVTIMEPGEIDDRYKSWKMETLPIIPPNFELKPIDKTKSQLTALGRLIRKKEVSTIVNACDAGREGELIFHYILEHEKGKNLASKTILRLWMQSMTSTAIKEAFANLRTHDEMSHLRDAALSRSEADWLVGINSSRGFTAYNSRNGGFRLTPAGRVQTPTLTLMVKREIERNEFVAQSYWIVTGEFTAGASQWEGRWFDPNFKKSKDDNHANAHRIWDEAQALQIAEKCRLQAAEVEESSKPSQQRCPPLYDLTSLQREANNRFGFSARTTLQIAQSLYEKHKLTTYPRTDSKFLPEDYVGQVYSLMGKISDGMLRPHAQKVLDQKWIIPHKGIFNNAKVTDHHAIIPTGNPAKANLSEAEAKIFTMIQQRFIAIFFPAAKYENTVRIATVLGEKFRTEGRVLVEAGWREVYGKESDDEAALAPLPANTNAQNTDIMVAQEETKPPPRYTEATLLSIMESAGKLIDDDELRDAMKERGLGTPATRAAVIEGLISDKYLIREGKELIPTAKASDLVNISSAMQIEDLTSPELTGEWEHKLGMIATGDYTREQFMGEIVSLTHKIVERIKSFDEGSTKTLAPFSPLNGIEVTETVSAYQADDIVVRKVLGGRNMSPDEVKTLLTYKRIGPLTGFRSKRGKEFTASIFINAKNKVEFEFADSAGSAENFDLANSTPLGVSPIDQSPVHDVGSAYASESALEGDKNGLRIAKIILGKELSHADIQAMLSGASTPLIKDFVSSKTRRKFDAKLKLNSKGKIEFEFPPREFKSRAKTSFKRKAPPKE